MTTSSDPGAPETTLAELERLRGPHPDAFLPVFGPPTRFVDLPEPERIVVSLPGWVGDVVMATPALRALRRRFPRARIVAHGKGHLLPLVAGGALVDGVVPAARGGVLATLGHARALRREGFHWAVLLAESERAAAIARLAGVPVRAGLSHTGLRRRLLTHGIPRVRSAEGHLARFSMVERYLMVTRALGAPDAGNELELPVTDRARAEATARLDSAGVDPKVPILVVVPGAAAGSSKTWPADRFAEATRALCQRHGLRAVLAPGPGEEPLTREVAAGAGPCAVVLDAPCLDLAALAALLERATLVLTNDTGPRSMAVALGRPTVVVAGPTDQAYTDHHLEGQRVLTADVPCRPCHRAVCPIDHRCMTSIGAQHVVEAASELLAGRSSVPGSRD